MRMTPQSGASTGERLLTSAEVAAWLGVTRETVCRACRTGALEVAYKSPARNGVYLVSREAVERWRGLAPLPGFELVGS